MTDQTLIGTRQQITTTYTPSLLQSIARQRQRQSLGITEEDLPFRGADFWNAYDFSWLTNRGKPEVAVAHFQVPCSSTSMMESKSLKEYLGSYSQTQFGHRSEVIATLESDLTVAVRAPVAVTLHAPEHVQFHGITAMAGQSLDGLDVEMDEYYWNPDYLELASTVSIRESVYSNLLATRCPETGRPDYGTVMIQYSGNGISHEGLLKYIISYREHEDYVEQIVERMYCDIMNRCTPERLTVHARFARRGGIDINPYRAQDEGFSAEMRLWRQ